MHSGKLKNSLPFLEKDLTAQVHSIVILPFHKGDADWKTQAYEIFSAVPGLSVVQPDRFEMLIKGQNRSLEQIELEERPAALGFLGRTLNADAALNGIILSQGSSQEVILQLVASQDARILWWQAAEYPPGPISGDEKKKILSRMLSPLIGKLAQKAVFRPQTTGESSPRQKSEVPGIEAQPPPVLKQKPEVRPDKKTRPSQPADDVSPM